MLDLIRKLSVPIELLDTPPKTSDKLDLLFQYHDLKIG